MTEPFAPLVPAAPAEGEEQPTRWMINPTGDVVEVPGHKVGEHAALGWIPASPERSAQMALQKTHGGLGGQVRAAGEGALQALTLGASDVALQPDVAYREANPGSYIAGQIAGAIAPALLSEGETIPGQVAEMSAPSVISKLGRAVEGAVAEHLGAPAESLAGRLAQRAVASGAGSAVEGAFYGAGNVVSESALGDPNEVAQSAFSEIGLAGALGFGLGALGGAAAAGLPDAVNKMTDAAGSGGTSMRDYIIKKYPEIASQLTGTSPDTIQFLLDNRHMMDPKSAGNKALMEAFMSIIDDTAKAEHGFGVAFNDKILPEELKKVSAGLGEHNETVNSAVEKLVSNINDEIVKIKGNPEFDQTRVLALERLQSAFVERTSPSTKPLQAALDEIVQRIKSDPNVLEYGAPNAKARDVLERLSLLRDTLPGLPSDAIPAARRELEEISEHIAQMKPIEPPPVETKSALDWARPPGRTGESLPAPEAAWNATARVAVPPVYGQELAKLAGGMDDLAVTPYDKLAAALSYKKLLSKYIPYGADRLGLTQDARNSIDVVQNVQAMLRNSLHDATVWGEAGARMGATDSAQHELLNARAALEKRGSKLLTKNAKGEWEVDPGKVKAWFRSMGDIQGDARLEDLKDYLTAAKNFSEEFKRSYTTAPLDGLDPTVLDRIIEKTDGITEQFRRQATAQRVAKELRAGSPSVLGGLGEAALGSVLGPVGGALGALHAVYGFAKNVPAAVGTLYTLERVSQAVNKAIKTHASTLVRAGTKAGNVMRGEVASGLAHGYGDDDATARKKYDKQIAVIRDFAGNPDKLHEALTKQTEGWQEHAPKIAQAFQTTTARVLNSLNQMAPSAPSAGPLAPKYVPSRAEISEFSRKIEAANDPVGSILRKASAGTLTPDVVQAVQTFHPQLYATMVSAALDKVAEVGADKLTYKTRLMLSMIIGQDLDGSTTQQAVAANQATFVFPKQEAPTPGTGPGPKKSVKINVANRAMTPMQAVEEGENHA